MSDDSDSGSRLIKLFLPILFLFLLVGSVHGGVVSGYFKPSVASGYSYHWYHREWGDYCPACHHTDCLLVNPKGVPESELTCSVCGADYCGVTGLDKGGGRWRLRRPQTNGMVDMGMVKVSIDMSLSHIDGYLMRETVRF